MNCAPFTLGHQYLVDQARQACDWLYVFVLSEDKGMFSPEDRLALVRQGCREFPNVSVHPTMGYLISNATFPHLFPQRQEPGAGDQLPAGSGDFCRQLLHRLWAFRNGLWARSPWTL
ncbi:MAG: adenylyltransferase/cytidyltransferase family protein [Oscillospiraceae bacterium]